MSGFVQVLANHFVIRPYEVISEAFYGSRLYSYGQRVVQFLKDVVEKVSSFIARHRMALIQYGLTTGLLAVFPRSRILQTVVPGFMFTVFHPDVPYGPDFLDRVSLEEHRSSWLPMSIEECGGNGSLRARHNIVERALTLLRLHGPYGWFILGGSSRMGKTEMMQVIAQQLVRQEVPVFKLNLPLLGAVPFSGALDSRFVAIMGHLAMTAARTGKTPVVIIDEFQSVFSHGFRLGDLLKSEMARRVNFNLLVATNQFEAVRNREPALYNRMQGSAVLERLDFDASRLVLQNVHEARFGFSLADDVIHRATTIGFAFSEDMALNEATLLIEGAVHRVRSLGRDQVMVADVNEQYRLRHGMMPRE